MIFADIARRIASLSSQPRDLARPLPPNPRTLEDAMDDFRFPVVETMAPPGCTLRLPRLVCGIASQVGLDCVVGACALSCVVGLWVCGRTGLAGEILGSYAAPVSTAILVGAAAATVFMGQHLAILLRARK